MLRPPLLRQHQYPSLAALVQIQVQAHQTQIIKIENKWKKNKFEINTQRWW